MVRRFSLRLTLSLLSVFLVVLCGAISCNETLPTNGMAETDTAASRVEDTGSPVRQEQPDAGHPSMNVAIEDGGEEERGGGDQLTAEPAPDVPMITTAKVGRVVVNGGIDKRVVRRILARHRHEMAACYELSLADREYEAGKVRMRYSVPSSGRLVAVSLLESTLEHEKAERCLVRAARNWTHAIREDGKMLIVEVDIDLYRRPRAPMLRRGWR